MEQQSVLKGNLEMVFVDANSDVKELSKSTKNKINKILESLDEKDIQEIHKALREFPKEEQKEFFIHSY